MTNRSALILNYHLIDTGEYQYDSFGKIYAVQSDDFTKHLHLLKTFAVNVVSIESLQKGSADKNMNIALTFDDGNPSDYPYIYDLLKKNDFTGCFFITVSNIKKNGLKWEHYKTMAENGFEIGSHGLSHCDLTTCSTETLRKELVDSKKIIEDNIQFPVRYFSLPFGRFNKKVLMAAKEAGYAVVFTTDFRISNIPYNRFHTGRWSIKRNTSHNDFIAIIKGDPAKIKQYSRRSDLRKRIMKLSGSYLINSVNILKNKWQ